MQVLLLEPDYWRYLGIVEILKSDSSLDFLGERDYRQILALQRAPRQRTPDVVIVSQSLIVDYRIDVIDHLRRLFSSSRILVAGYDETLETVACILRAGAKGYFVLSSEPAKLLVALQIVKEGHIWAPRDAVALMAAQAEPEDGPASRAVDLISAKDISILKLLQKGLANKQMARSLGVAEVTVKTHLTKLYKRFGVRTRLELLAYAITHRLISGYHAGRRVRETHQS